jgi:hypothetical protein
MKQPTVLFAVLLSGLILACVLTNLALSSQERDLCRNAAFETELCRVDACEPAPHSTADVGNQPTPTLAPPRPETASQNGPSFDLAKGQPVFLRVETDQHEIEVGWASP